MNNKEYLENIVSKFLEIKEISLVARLAKNDQNLLDWIDNNQEICDNVSPFEVCAFLQKMSIKMVEKKINRAMIANLYDPYSIMFAICMNQKSLSVSTNKTLQNIFLDVHGNTAKFDLFKKAGSRTRKMINSNDVLCELFWLIPFFCKPNVICEMNIEKYITESEAISRKVENYFEGYMMFVLNDVKNIDIPALKEHIRDGAIEYKKLS